MIRIAAIAYKAMDALAHDRNLPDPVRRRAALFWSGAIPQPLAPSLSLAQ